MRTEGLEIKEPAFQTGQEIRVFIAGGLEMAVPESSVAAVKVINDRQSVKYQQQASVRLKELGGFWKDLSAEFVGPLAGYDKKALKKMVLPVIVPKGIGLSELPDSAAGLLVVLSVGKWNGVMLCSQVHEQPIMLGSFIPVRNGDVNGLIERNKAGDILLINVISLLKREGFLAVVD